MILNIKKDKVIRLGHYLNKYRQQYEYYFTCLNKCFIIEYSNNELNIKEYLGGYKSIEPFYTIPINNNTELKVLDSLHSNKLDDMEITDLILLYLASKYLEDKLHHSNIEKAQKELSKTLNNLYNETII